MQVFLVVHGIVQGVGYRRFVAEIADKYKLVGFVRNVSDGGVEILVIGEDNSILHFKDEIHVQLDKIKVFKIDEYLPENKKFAKEFNKTYENFTIEKTLTR